MKNPLANINCFSTNLMLKIFAIGIFLAISVGLLLPKTEHFMMGMAFSWSGLLALQIFRLEPLKDQEPVDRDPLIQLNLS